MLLFYLFLCLILRLSHLTDSAQIDIIKLFDNHPTLFNDFPTTTQIIELDIDVGLHSPIKQYLHNFNFVKSELMKQVTQISARTQVSNSLPRLTNFCNTLLWPLVFLMLDLLSSVFRWRGMLFKYMSATFENLEWVIWSIEIFESWSKCVQWVFICVCYWHTLKTLKEIRSGQVKYLNSSSYCQFSNPWDSDWTPQISRNGLVLQMFLWTFYLCCYPYAHHGFLK